jgi:hypothetical protein
MHEIILKYVYLLDCIILTTVLRGYKDGFM